MLVRVVVTGFKDPWVDPVVVTGFKDSCVGPGGSDWVQGLMCWSGWS